MIILIVMDVNDSIKLWSLSADVAAVTKCLQYVTTTVVMDRDAVEWDKGW